MLKNIAIGLLIVIVVLMVVGAYFVGSLEAKASNQLLYKLTLPTPGSNLNDVVDKLGPKLSETDNLDHMITIGPVQSRDFCRDKKLFRFYASAPPARAVAVYTDKNNVVLFVTWHGL